MDMQKEMTDEEILNSTYGPIKDENLSKMMIERMEYQRKQIDEENKKYLPGYMLENSTNTSEVA